MNVFCAISHTTGSWQQIFLSVRYRKATPFYVLTQASVEVANDIPVWNGGGGLCRY